MTDAAQNEFDALVQKVQRISIQPFTPGQKAGILWAEGEIRRLREAVEWALGEGDSDFRPREEGDGPYWWRKELRRRAGL